MAESCVFGKQSLGPIRCGPKPLGEQVPSPPGAPLLPKLRGHYAEFLDHGSPDRLGMLYPPTCVGFGTGGPRRYPRGFSGGHGCGAFALGASSRVSALMQRGLPYAAAYLLSRGRPEPRAPALPRHRSDQTRRGRYGNVRPLRIGYASRPRLSPRLTLGGLASPRKPWACGGGVSRAALATHASILARAQSTRGRPSRFSPCSTLPYHRMRSGPPLRRRA